MFLKKKLKIKKATQKIMKKLNVGPKKIDIKTKKVHEWNIYDQTACVSTASILMRELEERRGKINFYTQLKAFFAPLFSQNVNEKRNGRLHRVRGKCISANRIWGINFSATFSTSKELLGR